MGAYLYLFLTVAFAVYGQIAIKLQMSRVGVLPNGMREQLVFLLSQSVQPWVFSSLLAGFFSVLCWMVAMTKFELSDAYPFTALSFVFLVILSRLLFQEPITFLKLLGSLLIMLGIFIGSRG